MESNIKRNVMRRVGVIRAVRPFLSGTAAGVLVLLVSFYEIGRLVFVAQVFRNMPAIQDVPALVQFFISAFLNTDVLVQLFLVLIIIGVAWIARDIARNIEGPQAIAF